MNGLTRSLHRVFGLSVTSLALAGTLACLSTFANADQAALDDERPVVEWRVPALDDVVGDIRDAARDDLEQHLRKEIRQALDAGELVADAQAIDDNGA